MIQFEEAIPSTEILWIALDRLFDDHIPDLHTGWLSGPVTSVAQKHILVMC